MVAITIGTNSYDSFISAEDADKYLAADILRASAWALLNADAKARALISATRTLLALPWCNEAPNPTEEVDEPIPSVTAMLAADLAAKPKLLVDAGTNSNVKSVKAGSVGVEFFSPVEGGPPISRPLWDLLLAAGLVCLGSDDDGSVGGAVPFGTSGGCRPLGGRWPWDWPIAEADYT